VTGRGNESGEGGSARKAGEENRQPSRWGSAQSGSVLPVLSPGFVSRMQPVLHIAEQSRHGGFAADPPQVLQHKISQGLLNRRTSRARAEQELCPPFAIEEGHAYKGKKDQKGNLCKIEQVEGLGFGFLLHFGPASFSGALPYFLASLGGHLREPGFPAASPDLGEVFFDAFHRGILAHHFGPNVKRLRSDR
jgi:hypothetical protein